MVFLQYHYCFQKVIFQSIPYVFSNIFIFETGSYFYEVLVKLKFTMQTSFELRDLPLLL